MHQAGEKNQQYFFAGNNCCLRINKRHMATQELVGVAVNITKKCNFSCSHCLRGESTEEEMTPLDYQLLTSEVNNPHLSVINITGGEGRLLSWFSQIGVFTRQALKPGMGSLSVDIDQESLNNQTRQVLSRVEREISRLPRLLRREWERSGESAAYTDRRLAELGIYGNRCIDFIIDTNGHFMTSPNRTLRNILDLHQQGFSQVRISTDIAHQEYVSKHPYWNINYKDLMAQLKELNDTDIDDRRRLAEVGIFPAGLRITSLGIGPYALPLGRAKALSWEERVRLGGVPREKCSKAVERIFKQLAREYDYWSDFMEVWTAKGAACSPFSHNYCEPARFYRTARQVGTYQVLNQQHKWFISVMPDLSANICHYNCIPAVGNLRYDDPEQVYRKASSSMLYKLLSDGGPGRVAQEVLSGWTYGQVRQLYIERTACGVCDFLNEQYPQQLNELLQENISAS